MFLVPTGTASNALALAHVTPPWGAVLCHEDAHIATDECGAPEFFGDGLKLVGLPGEAGKIAPATLKARSKNRNGARRITCTLGAVAVAGDRGRHDLPAGRDPRTRRYRPCARHLPCIWMARGSAMRSRA